MTVEELVARCVKKNVLPGLYDSMLLPIDLKERIADAINEAVADERTKNAVRIAELETELNNLRSAIVWDERHGGTIA